MIKSAWGATGLGVTTLGVSVAFMTDVVQLLTAILALITVAIGLWRMTRKK